jgi:glycosyltransferase involved in cell wall biosynthesis
VVTVSPLLRQALSQRYDFPEAKIDVVPNGVDPDRFRPGDRDEARARLGLPAQRKIVVCVAGFFSHHQLDALIAATAKAGALLVLVGKEGPTGGDILHAGKVPHEKVPDYIAAADACAYVLKAPHPQFGFSPLKVYEYMAGGRPVVAATDLAEIRSFINDEGVGTATGLEVDAYAAAMRDLIRNPERRRRLGERGRALAESRFPWSRSVEGVEAALSRALEA